MVILHSQEILRRERKPLFSSSSVNCGEANKMGLREMGLVDLPAFINRNHEVELWVTMITKELIKLPEEPHNKAALKHKSTKSFDCACILF